MLPDRFKTARILLRPVISGDADAIFSTYAQDEDVTRYLIWRPHRSISETQAYIQHCIATPPEVEHTRQVVSGF
jgi:RimJ/RimL family protein N-acetyltransferase